MEEIKIESSDSEKNKELITYNDSYFKYFVGYEIASLLGYANTTQAILNKVSKNNQLVFKNYSGIKEPELDSKTILITDGGVVELLSKTKKDISQNVLDILKKFNIDTTDIKCSIKEKQNLNVIIKTETEIISNCEEKNRELTTYFYISNYLYFEYFVGYEIASLLGYKNPAEVIKNNVSKSNQIIFRDYPGVKIPDLDPRTILITAEGAIEILIKCRKIITPDVLHILKKFNIDTTNKKCLTKEQQTLSAISDAFKTYKIEDQYKVGKYYLDMYFPVFKIVIECDELGHADRKPWKERERMDFVNSELGIDDSNWIRFNPDEYGFDVIAVINKIIRKIGELNIVRYIEPDSKKEDNEENKISFTRDDFEFEPITAKIKAPPKEFLEEKIKNGDSILKIGQSLGISSKPVEKWLKEYNLTTTPSKDKYKPPPKDELFQLISTKNQNEVALHYKQSTHIIRKWMKHYNLKLTEIKKNKVEIDKKEVVDLINEGKNITEISEKIGVTEIELNKYIRTNNIEKIPPKKDLEEMINKKSRDEIAEFYKTTRATLRKWLQLYDLDDIKRSSLKVRVRVVSTNNITVEYDSIVETCKELKMSHNKLEEVADTDELYNGRKFYLIRNIEA
jgi:very-short-patch-repair endonuclease/prophage antirepressor-like protein/transposase